MGKNTNEQNHNPLSKTGERLREVADRLHGGNKSELARSLGMKPASFSKYIHGNRRPGAVVLEKLSRMGVNINWFLSGVGPLLDGAETARSHLSSNGEAQDGDQNVSSPNNSLEEQLHQIPLVRIQEDSDGGLQMIETGLSEWISTVHVQKEYGVRPELLRDVPATGDAMADTIRPGDRVRVVLWDCQSPNDGTVCLVRGPVSLLLRRIRLKDRTIVLVADNPEVENLDVSLDQWKTDYEPIARVLEVRRAL